MADGTHQGKRTREIEDVTNLYVVHPLSRLFVTLFARLGIRPNTVSLLGMGFGAAAALAYAHYENGMMSVLGFLLMIGWHVMDGADGQLARLTGQTSEIGKVLDGLCDHGTFTLVYLSLTIALTGEYGAWVWVLTVLAGVSHVVQAGSYEFQRQSYDHWVHGKATARLLNPEEIRDTARRQHGVAATFNRLNAVYVSMQHRVAAYDSALFERLEQSVRDGRSDMVRAAYRDVNVRAVRRWGVLSSNYRTVAIFLASLGGLPILFFLYEVLVLNGVLLTLTKRQRRRHRTLRDLMDHAAEA